jgi:hypothetical protein
MVRIVCVVSAKLEAALSEEFVLLLAKFSDKVVEMRIITCFCERNVSFDGFVDVT